MSQVLIKSVRPLSYGDLTGRAVGIDSNVYVSSLVGFVAPGEHTMRGSVITVPAAGSAFSQNWPPAETTYVTQRTSVDVRNIYCSISVDNIDDVDTAADRCRFMEFRFYKARSGAANRFYLSQKAFTTIVGDNSVFKFEDLENINLDTQEYVGVEFYTNGTNKSICAFGLNFDLVMQRVVG